MPELADLGEALRRDLGGVPGRGEPERIYIECQHAAHRRPQRVLTAYPWPAPLAVRDVPEGDVVLGRQTERAPGGRWVLEQVHHYAPGREGWQVGVGDPHVERDGELFNVEWCADPDVVLVIPCRHCKARPRVRLGRAWAVLDMASSAGVRKVPLRAFDLG